jgi:hypothetical protein
MNDNGDLQDYQGNTFINSEPDPLDDLLTGDQENEESEVVSRPMVMINKPIENTGESLYLVNNKYQYDYIILLNNVGEDGLMDTYLNEANVESEKPRADPSDWFNFGLDEEKWIKLLNKNILMHYERHLLSQDKNAPVQNMPVRNFNNPVNQQGFQPHPFYYNPFMMGMRPHMPPHGDINK